MVARFIANAGFVASRGIVSTSSVMSANTGPSGVRILPVKADLPFPLVDERVGPGADPAVPHVADRRLVPGEQPGHHNPRVRREPADQLRRDTWAAMVEVEVEVWG